jgi:hypothetical protein
LLFGHLFFASITPILKLGEIIKNYLIARYVSRLRLEIRGVNNGIIRISCGCRGVGGGVRIKNFSGNGNKMLKNKKKLF